MTQFMLAHGYTPGPTQRPVLTGLLAGMLAAWPSAALFYFTGALGSAAGALHVAPGYILSGDLVFLVALGGLYGLIFQRAANDRYGSWLFALAFSFLLWLIGPVTVLQTLLHRPLAKGPEAAGLLASVLLDGLVLGLLFPRINKLLQRALPSGHQTARGLAMRHAIMPKARP